MRTIDDIEYIEQNFDVESLEVDGIKVWPFLRMYFAEKLVHDQSEATLKGRSNWILFQSFFYGFLNWFKSYDYIVLTDSQQRRFINGKYVSRCDTVVQPLDKVLYIELPVPRHRKRKTIASKNAVSKIPLYVFREVYSTFYLRKMELKNEAVLQRILNVYEVDLDYMKIIKRVLSDNAVMKKIIRRYKPKALFLTVSYFNSGYVKAAKSGGVEVVELQHGLVSKGHLAYTLFKDIDQSFYPDYLFVFGENDKRFFENGNGYFVNPSNVHALGHFYTDYVCQSFSGDKRFDELTAGYTAKVLVTAQGVLEKELLSFILECSSQLQDVMFILSHRGRDEDYRKYELPYNVVFANWLDSYQLMALCDFHSTIFSTCAVEALSMGIPNILININSLSEQHFDASNFDPETMMIANVPAQYIEFLRGYKAHSKEIIQENNKENIALNYDENVKKVLTSVLKTTNLSIDSH